MDVKADLLERLFEKLDEIVGDRGLIVTILTCLKTDEERQMILDLIEMGGEYATKRSLLYAAINIDDERDNPVAE